MIEWVVGGVLLGTITGLMPGIHPNLIAVVLAGIFTDSTILIFTTALTHTFLNSIPTTYLSTPDPDTALSLHPSQEYAKKGRAHEAIILTIIGSLLALILMIIISPLLFKIIKPLFRTINTAIPSLLILTATFLIIRQKNKLLAAGIFLLSGILGIISLNTNISEPLTPLFTGLFAIPSIIISSNEKTSTQKLTEPKLHKKNLKTILKSLPFGSFFSFLPAVGPAQAIVVQQQFTKQKNKKDFLILTGCLNTINIIFSLIMLIQLNKARNGAIAVIKDQGFINIPQLSNLFCIALIITLPCTIIGILSSRLFLKLKNIINPKTLNNSIICLLVFIIFILSHTKGILVLVIASVIGYLPYKYNLSKTTLMGSLMVPTIINYLH